MRSMILIIAVGLVSCAGNVQNINTANQAVYGVSIVIQHDSDYSQFRPSQVFFKRLNDFNNLKDGQIISSERRDDKGNFYITAEPGIYTVVAAVIFDKKYRTLVVFDEGIMNKMITEVKAGETKIPDELYVIDYDRYMYGKTDPIQELNRDVIAKGLNFTAYMYRPGTLNYLKYQYIKNQHDIDVENQKVEEYK